MKKIQSRRWQFKRILLGCIGLLFLFLFLSSGYNNYKIDGLIKDTDPENVWLYVSDFSKMRLLNPLIEDFRIVADSGPTHDWRYTVVYSERLGHWPHWYNTITSHFQVTQTMPGITPKSYGILSQTQTCFFKGLYCLHAESQFKFSTIGGDTYYVEHIKYQCPPFLSMACRRELQSQRQTVMYNLTHIFNKK